LAKPVGVETSPKDMLAFDLGQVLMKIAEEDMYKAAAGC
jgi:hypothetical protein